jgi:hypothetical protein
MTQAQAAPPPAPQPRQQPAPPDARARVTAGVAAASVDPGRVGGGAAQHVDTPALLNRWQVVAVSACVLFAIATAVLQVLSWSANHAAADNTEQLVRVQNIQSSLLRADSLATSAFLVGGLEPPAQRAAYDAAIASVTKQVAEAAEAQPADRDALAALNQSVSTYATTITQARDNNRQGFPVGSAYLSTGSSDLRQATLPIVSALVAANSERAEDEMGAQRPWLVVVPGVLALAVLWWVNSRMAPLFRRRFNLGLLAAFVVVAVLTVVAGVVSLTQRAQNNDLRSGSYQVAVSEATARSAGNDARANEALRLINRGSGAAFEEAYADADRLVTRTADADTLRLWQTYSARHAEVVALDEGGDWDTAVQQATSTDTAVVPDGSTQAFDAFDEASRQVVSAEAARTTADLRSGNAGILVLSIVTLLLGLAAAGVCTWGIAARRKEFS